MLSNHGVVRHLSRYARLAQEVGFWSTDLAGRPADLWLGERRARAAVLLTLALPGVAYLDQGEELGRPEVEDLPIDALQDPAWQRSGHTDPGRDGCRVPIPMVRQRTPLRVRYPIGDLATATAELETTDRRGPNRCRELDFLRDV